MELALPVPAQNHRLFAHAGDEVVAGLGNLAFVTDEQPGPGEDSFLFVLIDTLVNENLPADDAVLEIDEFGVGS